MLSCMVVKKVYFFKQLSRRSGFYNQSSVDIFVFDQLITFSVSVTYNKYVEIVFNLQLTQKL